ncbi:MAG: hypothetical protein RBT05_04360, partial [Bacteroidales bacterium]|nr:hypothetical protein [Bacteroidales bacterium]
FRMLLGIVICALSFTWINSILSSTFSNFIFISTIRLSYSITFQHIPHCNLTVNYTPAMGI